MVILMNLSKNLKTPCTRLFPFFSFRQSLSNFSHYPLHFSFTSFGCCIIFSPRIIQTHTGTFEDQYIWSIVIPPSISIVTRNLLRFQRYIRFRTDNRGMINSRCTISRFTITLINLGTSKRVQKRFR